MFIKTVYKESLVSEVSLLVIFDTENFQISSTRITSITSWKDVSLKLKT